MRERAVNHIDKHDSQQDNQRTSDIVDILLITGIVTLPCVADDFGNYIVHLLPPKLLENAGDRSHHAEGKQGIKPYLDNLRREIRREDGNEVLKNHLSPNLQ